MINKVSVNEMHDLIVSKLSHNFGVTPSEATYEHFYNSVVLVIKDLMSAINTDFLKAAQTQNKKHIYYLCMEFLMGRSLKNNLFNLGLTDIVKESLAEFDVSLDKIYEEEADAGLGNGGLGRLAACFLDALATQGYCAMGYSLRYEYGIFRQKLIDGWQTELPDFWLPSGGVWLYPHTEKAVEVLFDGKIREYWDGSYHCVEHVNANKVLAIPYDMIIPGINGKGISRLRIWASSSKEFNMKLFNSGDYVRAMEQNATAEIITKVLYPEDNHPEGKSLRLSQQYFLVSATIQDIVKRHLRLYPSMDNFAEMVSIHLNDTHPVLAIPELMRIMLDECGYTWDDSWSTVTKTFAYTNHTVMKEALECWGLELFKRRLPRIYQIIEEINKRFCAQMHDLGVDGYKVGRMAIMNEGIIRMANLAVAASRSVNGVSKLHSNILKDNIFKDFYTVMPDKFKNITNGIAYRRWLNQSNPLLASFISELIGDKYILDATELEKLMDFKDDSRVLDELAAIKRENKLKMSEYIRYNSGIIVDPDSIFDVQVKRLHEYKRQLLNALNILTTYNWLKDNPSAPFIPKTYIFAAKAAPGYYFAKEIIQFIVYLGNTINSDPSVSDKLKVIYLEDYKVTIAERLIPSAEISEQISLAGTEASGTGNMKLMINGAITLGTLDGANIEIAEIAGKDNVIIFGMIEEEVKKLRKSGYNPLVYYNNNPVLKNAIDQIRIGFNGKRFENIAHSLISKDPYMVMADFADYSNAQQKASELYSDKNLWNSISLVNIAKSGCFAADRAITEYAKSVWGAEQVNF